MHINTLEEIELLRHSSRAVVRELGLLGDAYFDIGVTLAERHLLIELESSLYPDVGEIAERLLLDKSTASRMAAHGVKKGLVSYTYDKKDKRRRCLQLTPHGRETLDAIKYLAQDQVKSALSTLSEDEVGDVQRGVALFAKGLKKARLRKQFTLDRIAPQDNIPLAILITGILEEYGCNKPGFAAQDSELQAMFESYQKPGHAYFVIRKGDTLVGGAGIAPLEGGKKGEGELRKMYLAQEARGLSLGDLLIHSCEEEAKKMGYSLLYLETTTKMAHAQAIYLRHGFKASAERRGSTGHFGCDLFFEKQL